VQFIKKKVALSSGSVRTKEKKKNGAKRRNERLRRMKEGKPYEKGE